jgi:hypothetical protein
VRLWSPREDIGSVAQKFKKSYIDEKYGVEEAEKKYAEWDKLMQQHLLPRKNPQSSQPLPRSE